MPFGICFLVKIHRFVITVFKRGSFNGFYWVFDWCIDAWQFPGSSTPDAGDVHDGSGTLRLAPA